MCSVLSDAGGNLLSKLVDLQDIPYWVKCIGSVRKRCGGFVSQIYPPPIQRLSCSEQEGWPVRASWTAYGHLALPVSEGVLGPCCSPVWGTEATLCGLHVLYQQQHTQTAPSSLPRLNNCLYHCTKFLQYWWGKNPSIGPLMGGKKSWLQAVLGGLSLYSIFPSPKPLFCSRTPVLLGWDTRCCGQQGRIFYKWHLRFCAWKWMLEKEIRSTK